MGNRNRKPIVLVFAGPNGSGKTTITRRLPVHGTYINADDLKAEYGLTDLEAAVQAENLRNMLLERGRDFSFETVMSTDRNLLLLRKAKKAGYEVHCIYVLTCNENINVSRVISRYASGGHDVPEEKIRTRYYKALALLPEIIGVCDKMLIYDNSDKPSLIFCKADSKEEIFPNYIWSELAILKLLNK